MKSKPRTGMKKTPLPTYDEKVNLLFPRQLCERAKPIARMLDISVSELFADFCEAALREHEKETTDQVTVNFEEKELNAILNILE